MSKKPADTKAADAEAAPKKRSTMKLALAALAPLVLAAGSYAGWIFFMAPAVSEAHAEVAQAGHGERAADGEAGHGPSDPIKVSSVSTEVLAETSATHSYALSLLIADTCGAPRVPALKAASEAEALADGTLVNLSWIGAARRTHALTDKACGYLYGEIEDAELALAGAAASATAGHGEAKPAH